MGAITSLRGREILDSRGLPTVEVNICLESGVRATASVPSGASMGSHEALEKRDHEERCLGKGVRQAVQAVSMDLSTLLMGRESRDQRRLDQEMCAFDGTPDKSRLGANAILGVSLALAKASSLELNLPLYSYLGGVNACRLPMPMLNILNGGAHASNSLDFQEFMIVPVGAKSFQEALFMGVEVFHSLKTLLKEKSLLSGIGDEGGFAPALSNTQETLDFVSESIHKAGLVPGRDVALALDVAASEFYRDGFYHLKGENRKLTSEELIAFYDQLVTSYPIVSIEDGLFEDDFQGWSLLTKTLGHRVQLVGDDLFVTNSTRLADGIEKKTANAILLKPNQVGSLTETIETAELAHRGGFNCVMSHRSGETNDTTIADLSVALNTGQIKTGAPCRGERVVKYNRLLSIEEELGQSAIFKNPFRSDSLETVNQVLPLKAQG